MATSEQDSSRTSRNEEQRENLRHVGEAKPTQDLAAKIRAGVAPLGGVALDFPHHEDMRKPPAFD